MRIEFSHRLLPKPAGNHPYRVEVRLAVVYAALERGALNPKWRVTATAGFNDAWHWSEGHITASVAGTTISCDINDSTVVEVIMFVPERSDYERVVDLFRYFRDQAAQAHGRFMLEHAPTNITEWVNESIYTAEPRDSKARHIERRS